jgi:hypothetical protein
MTTQQTTRALGTLTLEDLARYVGRKLANNTYVEADSDGSIGVRFHNTRILTFHPEGSFTVNTGGYRSVTTKQRLNALLPSGYRIFSERYTWKISTPEGTFQFEDGDTWK